MMDILPLVKCIKSNGIGLSIASLIVLLFYFIHCYRSDATVKKKPLKIAAIKEENYGLTFAAEKMLKLLLHLKCHLYHRQAGRKLWLSPYV